MQLKTAIASVFVVLCATPAISAKVWVVDDDLGVGVDYAEIFEAVAAASSGDTILVKDGTYSRFLIDGKGLTVIAEVGANVLVSGAGTCGQHNLPPGEMTLLRGMRFSPGFFSTNNMELENNQGTVVLEDIELRPLPGTVLPTIGLWVFRSDQVIITHCEIVSTITGFDTNEGMYSFISKVYAYDTDFVGADGNDGATVFHGPSIGGDGATIRGGTFFASGCTFQGGNGGGGGSVGCFSGQRGGHGLYLIPASFDDPEAWFQASQFAAGLGGPASTAQGCGVSTAGANGQLIVVDAGTLTSVSGHARDLTTSTPVRHGTESLVETFTGQAFDQVGLVFSAGVGPTAFNPGWLGFFHLAPPIFFVPKGLSISGTLTSVVPIPALNADAVVIAMQPVFLTPRQSIRLGAPSFPVFLR